MHTVSSQLALRTESEEGNSMSIAPVPRVSPRRDVAAGFHSQGHGEGRPPSQRTAALRHPPASVPLWATGVRLSCQYVGRASALRSLVNVEGLPREACAGLGA